MSIVLGPMPCIGCRTLLVYWVRTRVMKEAKTGRLHACPR